MANIKALDETLAYIEAHPETHDQDTWGFKDSVCGTTACFAGRHLLLTDQAEINESGNLVAKNRDPEVAFYGSVISEAARASLELTEDEALALFHTARDLEDVRIAVEAIKAGEDADEILTAKHAEDDYYDDSYEDDDYYSEDVA